MDYQVPLAIISVVIGLVAFFPYFRDILRRRTKPHAFTWSVWSVIMSISFVASLSKGGGYGAYAIGATAVACAATFVASLFRGEKDIARLDEMGLAAASVGILLWILTDSPLLAVIIVSLTDFAGFIPTFRKAYGKPWEETLSMYAMSGFSIALSIFALQSINPTTVIYPATVFASNYAFITMVMLRRRKRRDTNPKELPARESWPRESNRLLYPQGRRQGGQAL